MGSWEETCAVSNLPIRYGDDAVLIYLTSNGSSPTLARSCESDNLFIPSTMPIFGTYHDYGRLEYTDGPENAVGILSVQNLMKEINYSGQDHFSFQEDCERGEVYHNLEWSNSDNLYKVTPILIHRKVWDVIVSTKRYFFKTDTYLSFEEDLERGKVQIQEWLEDKKDINKLIGDKYYFISSYFSHSEPGFSMFFGAESAVSHYQNNLFALWDKTDIPLNSIAESVCSMIHLYFFMRYNRKAWHIPCGAGSQDINYDGAISFYESMAQIAKEEKEKYDLERL